MTYRHQRLEQEPETTERTALKNLYTSQTQRPSLRQRWQVVAQKKQQVAGGSLQTVLLGLMVPTVMMVLNLSMFSVAVPAIRDGFSLHAEMTAWLITAYALPFMMFMPLYGRLGDGLGKRRLFLLGVTIFLLGTGLILGAVDLRLLMVGRIIQGIGAAAVNPLCIAIISDLFPATQRGQALGTWNSIGPVTGIGGPLLAGFLVDSIGWRVIFGPVLLIGLVSIWVVWTQVPAMQPVVRPEVWRNFDWGGLVLLSAATTMLVFYVSSRPVTGVPPLRDWRLFVTTIVLFGGFVTWETRQAVPFINLNTFALKNFSRASIGSGIRMFTMSSGIGFLIPLYLVDVHQVSAATTGFLLMLHAGALLVTMRLGGQMADRWGSRRPVLIGASTQVAGMVYFALLPGTASLTIIVAGLAGHGLGAGLSLAALHRASMGQVLKEQTGAAAGLYSMIRFSGTLFGVALAGVVLQQGLDRLPVLIEAYQVVFLFLAGVALLGVISAAGLRE